MKRNTNETYEKLKSISVIFQFAWRSILTAWFFAIWFYASQLLKTGDSMFKAFVSIPCLILGTLLFMYIMSLIWSNN